MYHFWSQQNKTSIEKVEVRYGLTNKFSSKCGYYPDILICSFITWNVC